MFGRHPRVPDPPTAPRRRSWSTENAFAAAPVDDAIAHDTGAFHARSANQWSASAAAGTDHAAGAGPSVVVARISRANRMTPPSTSSVTPARNCNGPKEGVPAWQRPSVQRPFQARNCPRAGLNPRRVELRFISLCEFPFGTVQRCSQRGARLRNARLVTLRSS